MDELKSSLLFDAKYIFFSFPKKKILLSIHIKSKKKIIMILLPMRMSPADKFTLPWQILTFNYLNFSMLCWYQSTNKIKINCDLSNVHERSSL
jgi:hypothetical protein